MIRHKTALHGTRTTKKRLPKPVRLQQVADLLAQGFNAAEIGRILRISHQMAREYAAEVRRTGHKPSVPEWRYTKPKTREELSPEVLATLEDTPEGFRAFCDRYWPEQPMPEHVFRFVRAAWGEEGWRKRVILTVPPNHAKTTYFSVRWAIWRICQDRGFRLLLVSDTDDFARQVAGEIAHELRSREALVRDFGYFEAGGEGCVWQPSLGRIRVAGSPLKREYNVISRGVGTQIAGLRVTEIVCDDIVNPQDVKLPSYRDELYKTFHNVILSRIDPGTIVRVVGTRSHTDDLYGRLARERTYFGEPRWAHISFPAVLDWAERRVLWDCEQEGREHTAYPYCCRSFDFLMREAWQSERQFQEVYQQNPVPPSERLATEEDIEACLDRDRGLGPVGDGDFIPVVAIDPSGGREEGAIIAAEVYASKEQFFVVVTDIRKGRFLARETEAELRRLTAAGHRPQWLIGEVNIASWLREGQDPGIESWCRTFGVRLLGHYTHLKRKSHLELGFDSLGTDFAEGRIRLPYGDPRAREASALLIDEALTYPHGRSTDALMALWLIKANWRNLWKPRTGGERYLWWNLLHPSVRAGWNRSV